MRTTERSTGRWVAAVTIDGKRKRSVAKTEAEAKRRLGEMPNKVDAGRPIGDGALTVGKHRLKSLTPSRSNRRSAAWRPRAAGRHRPRSVGPRSPSSGPFSAKRSSSANGVSSSAARSPERSTCQRKLDAPMPMLGLRPGEANGLTWADIDLEAEVIHIRRSLELHDRRPVVTDQLKTDRSRRSLDAHPESR